MQFQTDGLTLTETSITDRFGTIGLDDLPDPQPRNETRLADSATPIMRRLWAIALADVESNIVSGETGRYFGAGTGFGVRVYTRDICLSGVLGLNRLYPWLMRDSIVHTRRLRAGLVDKIRPMA